MFDAKRLIGRKFDDAEVQSDMKHFPFKIVSKAGKPSIQVEYRGETKDFVRAIAFTFPSVALILPFVRPPRRFRQWC